MTRNSDKCDRVSVTRDDIRQLERTMTKSQRNAAARIVKFFQNRSGNALAFGRAADKVYALYCRNVDRIAHPSRTRQLLHLSQACHEQAHMLRCIRHGFTAEAAEHSKAVGTEIRYAVECA